MIKEQIKTVLERLGQQTRSLFLDNILEAAGEIGIGESQVMTGIDELKADNYIEEPFPGVIKMKS